MLIVRGSSLGAIVALGVGVLVVGVFDIYQLNNTKNILIRYMLIFQINHTSCIFHASQESSCLWNITIKLCTAKIEAWMLLLKSLKHHLLFKLLLLKWIQIVVSFKYTSPSSSFLSFLNLNNYLFFPLLFFTILAIP